ncbi:MAG: response regulator [Betaproteobacteria bacterium]|nr:response regulator [Betaproteobacteria bacterium]
MGEARRADWLEGVGRADALAQVLGEFVREAPGADRLAPALVSAAELARAMQDGYLPDRVDRGVLPAEPDKWTFVALGDGFDPGTGVLRSLRALGFAVEHAAGIESPAAVAATGPTVLLAGASWLAGHADRVAGAPREAAAKGAARPVLVAVADTGDFRSQVKARQSGARLLLDAPLEVHRLISELAGLAWMPRTAYRVLLVDDDRSVLAAHAGILRDAGFEVLAADDPVAAREALDGFAPEVCVLDVEMPACRGTDLAALFRRDKRFARLPVIFLSACADLEHQLDARQAGGEDYLGKPADARLLVAAVTARARQFRMFEAAYRQRRQAWRQLKNLRSALEPHAIVSVSSPDGSIIDANRKFCEISGYSREELIGRNHRIVKSGHHPPAVFEEMWQTISGGRMWQGEVQNRRKDGSHYWVQSTIVPILDEHGLPEQYISIRTDITGHKRAQAEQERQGRLLDAIRRALQHFIVAYDLASTSAMLLDAMLLLTDSGYGFIGEVLHDPDDTPYLKTHALSGIKWNEASRRLYERAQAKGMEFRKLDSLYGALLRTGETVIANDPANDPRCDVLPEGHPPVHAFIGVPIHVGKALVGMIGLTNRPGGYDPATVEFLAPVAATYADILEAVRQRHFQRQVIDDLVKRQAGGRLEADRCGSGRSFPARDDVPQPRAAGEIRPLPPSVAQGADRRRILVAEDNPANQALLRMQLDALGYVADIAGDGTVALAKWQAGGHDLILADRNMPGMDGLALARAIRSTEKENGSYTPIVAITAAHHPSELAACREAGMDDALPKPIDLDDLGRLLARWLPRASPVSPASGVSHPPPAGDTPAALAGEARATLDTHCLAHNVGSSDPARLRELVDLFTATVHAELPVCRLLLKSGDGHGLALVMHKLKSPARMVGALRFAGLAESLESAGRGGRLSAAAVLLRDLEHAVHDVEAAALQIAGAAAPTLAEVALPPAEALPRRVLVVDDDPLARRQISILLSALGVDETLAVDGGEAALAELGWASEKFDQLIIDLKMPGMDGIELLRRLAESGYRGCLIVASGVEDRLLQTAAELARAKGLFLRGTLKKPVTLEALAALMLAPCERSKRVVAPHGAVAVSPDDIREGISRDEFSVHFQPKVEVGALRVVGVEALARWQRADGPVAPDTFIGAAERHGLIARLSEVLVTKALIGGVRLAEAGFPLSLAVNMSANWLSDLRLPEFIQDSIEATGFLAQNLILEITETGVMADVETSLDVMSRLRLKDFKLSIDDFGTGYSSLEQLQRIPFGELKLDRSFVRGAAEKPATRAILASTIEMARKLKLSTVAEGVETQGDLDLVRGLGCDLAQGWLIARAMPVEELIEWLRARDAR